MEAMNRLPSTALPLFSRETELNELLASYRDACSGVPSAVFLMGDAGVGKSRLLHEFIAQVSDEATVALGHCLDTAAGSLPYLPFSQALRSLTPHLPDMSAHYPQWGVFAGTGNVSGNDLDRLQLFESVSSVVNSISQDRPLVIALEDLHWCDQSSRDLLTFLISRMTDQKLLLIGSVREEAMGRHHPFRSALTELVRIPTVHRLRLLPFDELTAMEFVRELNSDLTDEKVRNIARISEGNAYFAEELAADGGARLGYELAEILLSRLDDLSDNTRDTLRLASVVGRTFSYRLLAQAGNNTTRGLNVDAALREALAQGVIVRSDMDRYSFRHALSKEAIYADLLPGERVQFHRLLAEVLLAEGDSTRVAELAHHAYAAGDSVSALHASVQAANVAREVAAPAEELLHLKRALELLSQVKGTDWPDEISEYRLTVRSANAAAAAGLHKQAMSFGAAVVSLVSDASPNVRAEALYHHAMYCSYQRLKPVQAERAMNEAWDLLTEQGPAEIRVLVLSGLARVAMQRSQREAAIRWAQAAIEEAEEIGAVKAYPCARADALITLAINEDRPEGRLDTTHDRLQTALSAVEGLDCPETQLRARYHIGLTYMETADLEAARQSFEDGARIAATNGLTCSAYGLELGVRRVMVDFMLGNWDRAEDVAHMAGGVMPTLAMARVSAAALLLEVARGRFASAKRRCEYLWDRWPDVPQITAFVGISTSETHRFEGRYEQAVSTSIQAIERLLSGSGYHMSVLSMAAVGLGALADAAERTDMPDDDVARSRRLLANFIDRCFDSGAPLMGSLGPEGQAWLAQCRAEEARVQGRDSPELWQHTVHAFDHGEPYRRAYAQWRYAEALIAQDRSRAGKLAYTARGTAERLGANPLLRQIDDFIERAGFDARSTAPTPLTPRESDVVRLVAQGLTNRGVGAELYISEKTVSVHLSRAMAKLGAANRAQAVAAAQRKGLLPSLGEGTPSVVEAETTDPRNPERRNRQRPRLHRCGRYRNAPNDIRAYVANLEPTARPRDCRCRSPTTACRVAGKSPATGDAGRR